MASVDSIGATVVGTVHLLYLAVRVMVVMGLIAWALLMVWLWVALVRSRSSKIRAQVPVADVDAAYLEAAALAAASAPAEPSLFASLTDG